jgi:hypothetical protein
MPVFELPGGTDLDGDGVIDPQKIDHVATAIDRLPLQFKGKPNIEALLRILVEPAQELEDVFWTLVYERTLEKAVELGLDSVIDLIGKLVGEPRQGRTNADYARFIQARIATRRSNGLTEELITITRLVINDPTARVFVQWTPPAAVIIRIEDAPLADDVAAILIEFLKAAVSAGIRVLLEWSAEDFADWFIWDVAGSGFDEGLFVDTTDGL